MKTIAAVTAALILMPVLPAKADHGHEDWQLKRTLPSEAIETYEQAHPPPPPPAPPVTGVEQWRPLVEVYDWDTERMLRIMRCESGGNPNAVSHTDDWGLLQLHAPLWTKAFGVTRQQLLEPTLNVDLAWRIWADWGYQAWVCNRYIS
jgi:hypothetical protein